MDGGGWKDEGVWSLSMSTLDAVAKQLEFYFSNSNYPRDKFLRKAAAENDGCVFLPMPCLPLAPLPIRASLPLVAILPFVGAEGQA